MTVLWRRALVSVPVSIKVAELKVRFRQLVIECDRLAQKCLNLPEIHNRTSGLATHSKTRRVEVLCRCAAWLELAVTLKSWITSPVWLCWL